MFTDRLKVTLSKISIYEPFIFFIIILLFTPFEKIQFLTLLLALIYWLFKNRKTGILKLNRLFNYIIQFRILFFLFIFQFLNYLFAVLCKNSDWLAFPLFIFSFWIPMIIALLVNEKNYLVLKKFLLNIILFQVILVLIRQIYQGNILPNDFARGTISSAHWFGFCIVWFLFVFIFERRLNFLNILAILLSVCALFYCDAKTSVVSALLILLIIFCISFSKKMSANFHFRWFVYFALLGIILFTNLSAKKIYKICSTKKALATGSEVKKTPGVITLSRESTNYVSKVYNYKNFIGFYITGQLNHKFLFIKRGLQYILINNLAFLGTSPGTLGSRASNVRAGDVLYKPDGLRLSFLGIYSSPATKQVYNNLYTQQYHYIGKSYIKTLASPFSSFFSFLFENGIIGTGILLICIISLFKICFRSKRLEALENIFMLFFVFFIGLFDTVWERPFVMGLFYLILAINFQGIKYKPVE